jgi:hypothetical protein
VALLLGADPATVDGEVRGILEFEVRLANISLAREERRDVGKLYNPMRISDLGRLDPTTPWLDYVNTLLPATVQVSLPARPPLWLQVSADEPLVVHSPDYIAQLGKLLQATPGRVQVQMARLDKSLIKCLRLTTLYGGRWLLVWPT